MRETQPFGVLLLFTSAVFDVLLILIGNYVIFSLFKDAPYLPEKYAQKYTHLATFRAHPLPIHRETVRAIAFSRDGQTLAISIAEDVYLWQIKTGKPVSTLSGHLAPVNALVFSPDGKTLASASRNRERIPTHPTILWDPSARIQKIGHYHLASYTIRLWDTKTATSRLTFTESISPLTALEFSPNSTKLLIASQNGIIDVYDSFTGHRELDSLGLFAHDRILNKIGTIAFAASPGDKIITSWIWETDDFMPRRISKMEAARGFSHKQWFTHFRFVGEPAIGLNVGPGRSLSFLIPNTYRVNVLTFSAATKILASGGRDRETRLYDIADGTIQLWDPNTGHLLHTFNSPGGWVKLLTFSPDGKTLASVGKRWWNKICIWDTESHRLLSIINTGKREIKALQFAPDSITLASGHSDGIIHLWDITGSTKDETSH